jgi:Ca2+-binding RTX toxin-like protein
MKADLEGGADSGTDFLAGGSESDRLKGKGGDHNLRVNAGDDCLGGGTESDRLNGGSGEDLLKGGAGNDVINAKDGEPDKVRCGFGDDRATVDPTDAVKACEIVS